MNFKEKWNEVDKKCITCNQITERSRGITKQNLKRLLIPKFDLNELLITFLIIMIIVLTFSYKHDTQQSRDWINEMHAGGFDQCMNRSEVRCKLINTNLSQASDNGEDFPMNNISIPKE